MEKGESQMPEKIDNNQKSVFDSPSQSLVEYKIRLYANKGFWEVRGYIEEQIQIENFSIEDKPYAQNICSVITEVLRVPNDIEVKVDNSVLSAKAVKEIFLNLEYEHIEWVIEKIKRAKHEIKYMKSYLRTTLYNSFFELESKRENEFNIIN